MSMWLFTLFTVINYRWNSPIDANWWEQCSRDDCIMGWQVIHWACGTHNRIFTVETPPTPEIKARNKRKLCTPNKAYQKLVWNVEMSRRYGMFLTVRGLKLWPAECARSRNTNTRKLSLLTSYAALIDWMIWKIAEPHTTNTKRASIHGPTGYFSSLFFSVLGTFPLCVTFFEARSLATRIRCFAAILENF